MSSDATPQDWEDFWYAPEKFGTWYPEDILSNPEDNLKSISNYEVTCQHVITFRRLPMTLPKDKKLKHEHIESMKLAVEEADIRSIHPDKMEEFAEYLVQKARTQE